MLANDDVQGPGVATYIKDTMKADKVCVIDDASDYGKGLADIVTLDARRRGHRNDTIDPKDTDYSAAVTKVKAAASTPSSSAATTRPAGPLAKQLRDAGVKAKFVVR